MSEPTVSRETEQPAPSAPWGLNARGLPYKRDPATYASRTGAGRKRAPSAPAPLRRASPNKATTEAQQEAQTRTRANAVFEVLSIPVAGLAMAGQRAKSKPLVADAIVLGRATPSIALAVAQVADQDERVARIVDQLVATGPWAALFTALMPVAVQIAANHSASFANVAGALGAQSVEEILASAIVPDQVQPEAAAA